MSERPFRPFYPEGKHAKKPRKGGNANPRPTERKPTGWHSNRHETADATRKAQEARATRSFDRPRQRWNENAERWERISP
jgi:hypothetical protein